MATICTYVMLDVESFVSGLSPFEMTELVNEANRQLAKLQNLTLTPEEQDLHDTGHSIEAVKRVRLRAGITLKQAKYIVDTAQKNFR